MKGSVVKRCACPPSYDAKGNRKACPRRHGSWSYVIDTGKDPQNGRRRQLKKGGFATRGEAESAMAEVLTQVDQGRYRHDGRRTVKDWCEEWLEHAKSDFRPTTYVNASRWLRATYPHIGHLRLRDLRTSHVSAMLRTIHAENARRGVGATTTRRIAATLSSCLTDARKGDLIQRNPVADAWRPEEKRQRIKPWSGEELGRFLDATADHQLAMVFEVIAHTGLRRGEALGLRWADVDLEHGVIEVTQQVTAVTVEEPCPSCGAQHRGCTFGDPKTDESAAKVELSSTLAGALLLHRMAQDAQRSTLGAAYVDHDLVLADVDGNPLMPNYVTKQFAKLVRTLDLPEIRLHDMRHGVASLMLASGVDIAVVSKVLRHSRIRTTSDTYAHLLDGVGKQAAEAAASLIVRKPRDHSVTSPTPKASEASPGDPEEASDLRVLGGAEGTRTPDPLHAMQPDPVPDGDGQ